MGGQLRVLRVVPEGVLDNALKVFSTIFSTMLLGVFFNGVSSGVPWFRLVPVVWGMCEGVGVGVFRSDP